MAPKAEMETIQSFAGFHSEGFAFLRDLAREQNRDWFLAHKGIYEAALLSPMAALLSELTQAFEDADIPLRADPKGSVFRIHRDVRFSRDKRPYKTHVGATLTRDGAKLSPGVLYIHIDPAGSFVASGFYRPEPKTLDAIRAAIVARPAAWRHALGVSEADGLELESDPDALKRTPRGFDGVSDAHLLDALRRKSFIVRRKLTTAETGRRQLVSLITDVAEAATPLLRFGWAAIDG